MKALILLFTLLSSISVWAAIDGNDNGHGGDVFEIGAATRLFDKLEYEEAFNPARDVPEFRTWIRPRLVVLGNKLPRTARLLLHVLSDSIAPRWYFVKYQLKDAGDSGHSSLIISYYKEQVALNTGSVVQINKEVFAKLSSQEKAWLLVHEALWSAVGTGNISDGSKIRRLTSLIFHPELGNFSPESIGEEIRKLMEKPGSPLQQRVDEDLNSHGHTIFRWSDVSTDSTGKPSICLDGDDQCVMRDESGYYWTALSPGAAEGGRELTAPEADEACRGLKHWGGFSDWRLPSTLQTREAFGNGVGALAPEVPAFGGLGTYVWTSRPYDGDEPRQFAYDLSSGVMTHFEQATALPWRCVRGDYRRNWKASSCDGEGECVLKEAASGLQWAQLFAGAGAAQKLFPQKARDLCEKLNWGGQTGWRLPLVSEYERAQRLGLQWVSQEWEAFGDLTGPVARAVALEYQFYAVPDAVPLTFTSWTFRLGAVETTSDSLEYPWLCVK